MGNAHRSGKLDKDMVARLLMKHQGMLRSYVSVVLRDRSLVDDVLQEIAVVVVERAETDTDVQRFPAWARGVARRVALSFARKQQKMHTIDSDALDSIDRAWDGALDSLILEERKDVLRKCMEKLPAWGIRLLRLRYEQGMGGKEIASVLKRTINGVYVALSKAHTALADCVNKYHASGAVE